MVVFQTLFMKSKGQPIEYNGKVLQMVDRFPTNGCTRFELRFESVSSEWKQGVSVRADCDIVVSGVNSKQMLLWEHYGINPVVVELVQNVEEISIKNIWDVGDGVVHSWHNGAAMVVEPIENGNRYLCNDGHPDDDCNDIIFTFSRIQE